MYETAIDAVVQAGIMTGYGNGMFRPAGVLTRYEMSVVLQRVFQLKENENSAENFKDVPNGHWAKGYVKALVDNKISKRRRGRNF